MFYKQSKSQHISVSKFQMFYVGPHTLIKLRKKALGFIKPNIKTNNSNVKTLAYNSLVRLHLEYSCQVWDPHADKNVHKLEAVQHRSARYITNRYHNPNSPSEMVSNLQWDTLQQRRAKIRLTTLYKIINNLIEIPYEQYLLPSASTYVHQTLNFQRPFTATNYFWNICSFLEQ